MPKVYIHVDRSIYILEWSAWKPGAHRAASHIIGSALDDIGPSEEGGQKDLGVVVA